LGDSRRRPPRPRPRPVRGRRAAGGADGAAPRGGGLPQRRLPRHPGAVRDRPLPLRARGRAAGWRPRPPDRRLQRLAARPRPRPDVGPRHRPLRGLAPPQAGPLPLPVRRGRPGGRARGAPPPALPLHRPRLRPRPHAHHRPPRRRPQRRQPVVAMSKISFTGTARAALLAALGTAALGAGCAQTNTSGAQTPDDTGTLQVDSAAVAGVYDDEDDLVGSGAAALSGAAVWDTLTVAQWMVLAATTPEERTRADEAAASGAYLGDPRLAVRLQPGDEPGTASA